jgi:hypothetical protein
MWGEEQHPRTGPLLTRGAVKEESPVRSREDQSSGLCLTVVRAPWGLADGVQSTIKSASTWLSTAWCGTKFSSNSANSAAHLAILPVALGLWSTALNRYEVTTEIL